jgi:flagellar biogenesis protein FliO
MTRASKESSGGMKYHNLILLTTLMLITPAMPTRYASAAEQNTPNVGSQQAAIATAQATQHAANDGDLSIIDDLLKEAAGSTEQAINDSQKQQPLPGPVEEPLNELSMAMRSLTGEATTEGMNANPKAIAPQGPLNPIETSHETTPPEDRKSSQSLLESSSLLNAAQPQDQHLIQDTSTLKEIMSVSGTGPGEFAKTAAAILGALIVMAMIGWQILRNKKAIGIGPNKSPRALQLTATLPIGPKRQILLIRVRDSELAIASTEHGVTVLSHLGSQHPTNHEATQQRLASADQISAHAQQALRIPQQIEGEIERANRIAQIASPQHDTKSDILKKALETIENKRKLQPKRASDKSTQDSAEEDLGTLVQRQAPQNIGTTLPASPGGQRFRKFFANTYQQQEKIPEKPDRETGANNFKKQENTQRNADDAQAENQTENVAQLIRDKLKQMRAIN